MSATITQNNLKFVIFGSGHDYTRLDSGMGEKTFFSHPFVPLNSVNYAGQYYFLVPDQNGEFFDAVKEDLLHCTFDPDLGTAFDTEGEVTIKVSYRREYILPEETILVEKELEQTITVVDHGAITDTFTNADLYSDGYLFIRPVNYSSVVATGYYSLTSGVDYTKVSSIPWRATSLGYSIYGFLSSATLEDISELEYADTSNCTLLYNLFENCSALEDISAMASWDVSQVQRICYLGKFSGIADLTPLKSWDVSSVVSLDNCFSNMTSLQTLDGLENWDVSACTNLGLTFDGDTALEDISALAKWDVSSVTTLESAFKNCRKLNSLEGLKDWDVSSVTRLDYTFYNNYEIPSLLPLTEWKPKPTTMLSTFASCTALTTLQGIENFDTSACTTMKTICDHCTKLVDINGVETWDVSAVTDFSSAFAWCYWIADISAIADWEFGTADCNSMFLYVSALLSVDDLDLDLSACTDVAMMFYTHNFGSVDGVGVDAYEESSFYYDYDGNSYSSLAYTLTLYGKDATDAENWSVSGTGLGIFDSNWSNRPSWN